MHLGSVTLYPDKFPTTERYPFNQRVLQETRQVTFSSPVTFFVGENGSGKTTLLTGICRRCGIHIWRGVSRSRVEVNPYEDKLGRYLSVQWIDKPVPGSFFASDLFRAFAQVLDEMASDDPGQLRYFGGKSLLTQSHGQSIMSMFRARYKIRGLYLLDEPETALSPKTQLALLALLQEMAKAGHAQFIIATHSPILMACPGAEIWNFDEAPLQTMRYEDTEHYKVYRDFMVNMPAYLEGSNADSE